MGRRGRKRSRSRAPRVLIRTGEDDALGALVEELPRLLPEDRDEWDMDTWRAVFQQMAEHVGDWQGIPIDLEDFALTLAPGHPLAEVYRPKLPDVEVVVGGPSHEGTEGMDADAVLGEVVRRCYTDDVREDVERLVNQWHDGRRNRDVLIYQKPNGRAFAVAVRCPPDRAMDRLTMAVMAIGASDAWSMDAEAKAVEKLQTHVSERQLRHYLLTGSFLETSKQSGLTYVFRRLRPTVVMTPRWPWYNAHLHDTMRVLAVLCMHPIGYYGHTWAGCMVPTDDVIAHLLYMRGDEAGFWRQANQHDPASPEAGL